MWGEGRVGDQSGCKRQWPWTWAGGAGGGEQELGSGYLWKVEQMRVANGLQVMGRGKAWSGWLRDHPLSQQGAKLPFWEKGGWGSALELSGAEVTWGACIRGGRRP